MKGLSRAAETAEETLAGAEECDKQLVVLLSWKTSSSNNSRAKTESSSNEGDPETLAAREARLQQMLTRRQQHLLPYLLGSCLDGADAHPNNAPAIAPLVIIIINTSWGHVGIPQSANICTFILTILWLSVA